VLRFYSFGIGFVVAASLDGFCDSTANVIPPPKQNLMMRCPVTFNCFVQNMT